MEDDPTALAGTGPLHADPGRDREPLSRVREAGEPRGGRPFCHLAVGGDYQGDQTCLGDYPGGMTGESATEDLPSLVVQGIREALFPKPKRLDGDDDDCRHGGERRGNSLGEAIVLACMAKAIWNGKVLADSNETVVVEGNHYFPPESVNTEYFSGSDTNTRCHWKGTASYYDVVVDGDVNKDAAWFYPTPSDAASEIKDHVAFWRGVKVEA